jgi:ribosome modulation factor
MTITDRDIARAQQFGRLAAAAGDGLEACPYSAQDPEQRLLRARWVLAYTGAGGRAGVAYSPLERVRAIIGAMRRRHRR